jgi:hypothetical protein
LSFDGSTVTFYTVASSSGLNGLYAVSASTGIVKRIADSNTPYPGGAGTFNSFFRSSVKGATVLFEGNSASFGDPNVFGMFTAPIDGNGPVTKILAPGDTVDGRVVTNVGLGKNGNDGSLYAFGVRFTDNTEAIYSFTPVPEPTGPLPFSVAAAAGAFAARRRRSVGFISRQVVKVRRHFFPVSVVSGVTDFGRPLARTPAPWYAR